MLIAKYYKSGTVKYLSFQKFGYLILILLFDTFKWNLLGHLYSCYLIDLLPDIPDIRFSHLTIDFSLVHLSSIHCANKRGSNTPLHGISLKPKVHLIKSHHQEAIITLTVIVFQGWWSVLQILIFSWSDINDCWNLARVY